MLNVVLHDNPHLRSPKGRMNHETARGGSSLGSAILCGMRIPSEAKRLRRQASRALRLAHAISDEQAAQALMLHADNLLKEAERLEQQNVSAPRPTDDDQ